MNPTDLKPLISAKDEINHPLVIAGPCSAETEEQTLLTARQLAASGIRIFRAGVWKPRTKPGGFEGAGAPALNWLKRVKEETGMLTAVEVATAAHVREALEAGTNILWIGARTSANPFAVDEIARTIAEINPDTTVLVKNPVNPDLELWIGAIERVYDAGIRRIGAVHRGFSAFESRIYRNPPHWQIPIELRRRFPQLPLLHDPSHTGGRRELIAPLAQQAMDLGFDGLMIEAHCDPERALSDMNQQITPEALAATVGNLVIREQQPSTPSLDVMRQKIDAIDSELIEILARRMNVSREIGRYKKENRMPAFQVDRHDDIMKSRLTMAEELGVAPEFMKAILSEIHEESVKIQMNILNSKDCGGE